MELLERFNSLVQALQSTTGRIEKKNILSQYEDDEGVKCILQFIYDPYTLSGMSNKSLSKVEPLSSLSEEIDILSVLTYLRHHHTGRQVDLGFVKCFILNNPQYADLISSTVCKDLKLGVQPTTLNKVFGKGFIKTFGVQLAERYFENPEKYLPEGTEFILTTKMDGIRCICMVDLDGGVSFFTRQGQPIEGLVDLEEEALNFPHGVVIDGELLLENLDDLESKDLYRKTVKVVNSDSPEKRLVYFNAFDMLSLEDFQNGEAAISTYKRKDVLQTLIKDGPFKFFVNTPILYRGTDQSKIQYWLDKITSEGGEGVMINISDAPYVCKHTKYLLKCKKFNSADVRVLDMEEGTGSNKGRLGAVKVEFLGPDGKSYTCKVGSGFEQAEREHFWKHPEDILGKIIQIKYFEISNNQSNSDYSLRFPTFEEVRFDKDEISMH